MKISNLFALASLLCMNNAIAGSANYDSCKFNYDGGSMSTKIAILSMKGVADPEGTIYGLMCKASPSSVFEVQPVDGEDRLKATVNGCSFEVNWKITGNRFRVFSNHDDVCKTQGVSNVSKMNNTDYSVGCNDGSSGTVHYSSSNNICASGGAKSVSICKHKSQWSVSLAAAAICGH